MGKLKKIYDHLSKVPGSFETHYMFWASLPAIVTAIINLGIIYWMSKPSGLDHGLGLAAIGITTFCGILLSSSIFEEHRHGHGSVHAKDKVIVGKNVSDEIRGQLKGVEASKFSEKLDNLLKDAKTKDIDKTKIELVKDFKDKEKNSDFIFVDTKNAHKTESGSFIEGVIVGTGIMRKALAGSLVITYIVLIGLSFSAGSLDDAFKTEPESTPSTDAADATSSATPDQSILGAATNFIFSGKIMEEVFGQKSTPPLIENLKKKKKKSTHRTEIVKVPTPAETAKQKSIEELLLEKNPRTLVEHFTIVITAIVGFYFGSNTLKSYLDTRKEDLTRNKSKESDKEDSLKKILEQLKKVKPSDDDTYKAIKSLIEKGKLDDSKKKELQELLKKS